MMAIMMMMIRDYVHVFFLIYIEFDLLPPLPRARTRTHAQGSAFALLTYLKHVAVR